MNAVLNDENLGPADLLADLIARHGRWRVVAALAGLLVRAEPQVRLCDLSDHLRRDVGLPDLPPRWVAPAPPRSSLDNPMFRL